MSTDRATIEVTEPAKVSKFLARTCLLLQYYYSDMNLLSNDILLRSYLLQVALTSLSFCLGCTEFEKPENKPLMPSTDPVSTPQRKTPNTKTTANNTSTMTSTNTKTNPPHSSVKDEVQAAQKAKQTGSPSAAPSGAELLKSSSVVQGDFAQGAAERPLRVCCYGSSSSDTPFAYLQPAAEVGYLLAKRGHTCVNGAGSFGCMSAMNEGAAFGNGHLVGVIHKMWLVDGPLQYGVNQLRDGGAHPVFDDPSTKMFDAQGQLLKQDSQNDAQATTTSNSDGPIREIFVAGGKDLQERKRLLVEGADALVVLPGGPGTWDELWEMACARNIGLSKIPIVCVNIDGYYEPFREILDRAHKDKLVKLDPAQIVHFADSAEEAIKWCEEVQKEDAPTVALKKRSDVLRSQSIMGSPVVESMQNSFVMRSLSIVSDMWVEEDGISEYARAGLFLGAGLALGFILSESRHMKAF